jgi:hypothetical protein
MRYGNVEQSRCKYTLTGLFGAKLWSIWDTQTNDSPPAAHFCIEVGRVGHDNKLPVEQCGAANRVRADNWVPWSFPATRRQSSLF